MKTSKVALRIKAALTTACVSLLMSACSPPEAAQPKVLPAVNDANCTDEALRRIKDKEVREELVSACLRRGKFKPSPVENW